MDSQVFWFLTGFCLFAYLFPRFPAGVEFYFKLQSAASVNIDYRHSVEHSIFFLQILEALVLSKSLRASSFDIKSPDKDKGLKNKFYFIIYNKAYSSVTRINTKFSFL
jgi:hypothetical protein